MIQTLFYSSGESTVAEWRVIATSSRSFFRSRESSQRETSTQTTRALFSPGEKQIFSRKVDSVVAIAGWIYDYFSRRCVLPIPKVFNSRKMKIPSVLSLLFFLLFFSFVPSLSDDTFQPEYRYSLPRLERCEDGWFCQEARWNRASSS